MKKEDFWNWFDENKGHLEDLISGKTQSYETYESLSEKLKKVEIAKTPQNRRFFEKDVVPAGIEPASKV
jgi:hypothetical protein